MKNQKVSVRIVAAVLLLVFALISFSVLGNYATDAQNYVRSIQAIDEKKATVMTLTATAAAASTGLASIPGDATTPIATQIMEISEYLFIVVCFLVLEKSLLTVMGFLGFKILLPMACVLMAVYVFLRKPGVKLMAMKMAVLAVLIVAIIPLSVRISDMIYEVNKVNVEELNLQYQETVPVEETTAPEETVPQTEPVTEESGWFGNLVSSITDKVEEVGEKGGDVAETVTEKVTESGTGTVEEAKELLNRFVDAIALFVITYCAIPVIVVLAMVWFVKLLFQVQIPVPELAVKPFGRKHRAKEEENALTEV